MVYLISDGVFMLEFFVGEQSLAGSLVTFLSLPAKGLSNMKTPNRHHPMRLQEEDNEKTINPEPEASCHWFVMVYHSLPQRALG